MGMTNTLETAIINHILRQSAYTPVATTYAGIISTLSDDGTTFTEFAAADYARQPIAQGEFDAASGGATSNNVDIVWPAAAVDWGSARYIGIFNALAGGDLLWWGELPVSKFVARSAIFTIEAGELALSCAGAYSLDSRNGVLNLTLRNNSPSFSSPAQIWVGVGSTPGSQNASLTEPSAGYSRVRATSLALAGAGVVTITAPEITFTSSGGDWGLMTHVGLFDLSTLGTLLFALQLSPSRAIYDGDGMVFETSTITARIT